MDTICPAVWDNLCINTNGKNRLCCNSVTHNHSFLDNYNYHWTEYRNQIKKQMLNNKRPEDCISCWEKEDLKIHSLRNSLIETYKETHLWNDFLNNIHNVREYPLDLDLKLGNYCNLSCRMCNSYSSSKYQNEFKKIYKDTKVDYGVDEYEKNYVQKEWYNSPLFFDFLKKCIDNGLRSIKFTGGEPLMVPNVLKIIDYCIETNQAQLIKLTIITNVTLIDENWINKLLHFKEIILMCSIDGTDSVYEYIRHPANWTDVYNKLKIISKITNNKIKFILTFTLQIYNIFEIENIINLKRELNSNLTCIVLDKPSYLDVKNAPINLKNEAIKRIQNIEIYDHIENLFIKDVLHKINQKSDSTINQIEKFKTISILKDKYKKQNITNLEIWYFYKNEKI